MKADNGVGKVGVETHSWSEGDGQVGEQAHAEGSQSGNGSCRSDQIPLDDLDAQQIFLVCGTQVGAVGRTDAGTTALGYNGR